MRFLSVLFAIAVAACVNEAPPRAMNINDPSLDGVWISKAYGEIYDVSAGAFTYYEWTDNTCVRGEGEGEALEDYVSVIQDLGDGSIALSSPEEPYPYVYERLSALPATCRQPSPDTIQSNFDVFASAFETYYPFFDLYGVDWQSVVDEQRALITDETTELELFRMLRVLVSDLKDAHIEIRANINGEREIFDANAGKTETNLFRTAISAGENPMRARAEYRRKFWLSDLQQNLHHGEGVIVGDGAIQYGLVSGDIGMISLRTMGGFMETEEDTELGVLNAALDDALGMFEQAEAKAVIVNLAMNYGGYDYISRALAERFTAQPTRAYSKRSANDPHAEPFVYTLKPSEGVRFTGPVYLLTSDVTVSAGEIATLSLRALPNVTHVGEATRGAFSDVLSRQLPNGWEFTLSSEFYYDHEGEIWEGKGVPPEIEIPVFDQKDPHKGFLEAMTRLVELIDADLSK